MHRPLWQIFLCLFLIAFVVRSGALAYLMRADGVGGALAGAYAFQTAAGLAVLVGLWLARRWVIGAVPVLGVAVGATALLQGFFLDLLPGAAAVAQLLVAAVVTGGLTLVLRYELGESGSARGPAED